MVLTPAPHRHELDNTIHATFLYTTARLHPFSMQLPAVQEGQSMPEAVLRQQHGPWERTRRAPRPQPDGGDADGLAANTEGGDVSCCGLFRDSLSRLRLHSV